jgi:hypothetical protein
MAIDHVRFMRIALEEAARGKAEGWDNTQCGLSYDAAPGARASPP